MNQPIRCFEGKAQPHESFWTFRAASETGGEPTLEFYGVISEWSWLDDEITPKKFKDELNRVGGGGPLTVRIDSPGGDPIAASTIASIITSYPGKITAQIDGQASSAAVMVALAASHIRIMDSAYMMIHNPRFNFFMAALDADIMHRFISILESIKQGMAQTYAARTGLAEEKVSQMMSDETWMSAKEAVDLHFADEVLKSGQKRPIRKFENLLKSYEHVPAELLNLADDPENDDAAEQPVETAEQPQAALDGAEGEQTEVDEQEPSTPLAFAKTALARLKNFQSKGATMFLRELTKKRSDLLAEAESLVALADKEGRDFTAEERARFVAIMGEGETIGEIGALDAQIEQIEGEREQLRAAAEKKFLNRQTQKPEPPAPGKTMKRAEFEALSPADQSAFVRGGGKVED